jgi:DNA-binding response OmpR family regulator
MLTAPCGQEGLPRFPGGWVLMAERTDRARILLIEDDDGDAFLIEELLREAGGDIAVQRVQLPADPRKLVAGVTCVLLDLGLPDSTGLHGLRR